MSTKTCYYPNGARAKSDKPCRDGAGESACCAPGQICLDNKYCLNVAINPPFTLARGSCTDENWQSGNCPSECRDVHVDGGCAIVLQSFEAGVSRYCCNALVNGEGTGLAQCMDGRPTFALDQANIIPGRLLLENLTTTGDAGGGTASPQPTPTGGGATPGGNEAPSGTDSRALQVGLGVGLPLGIIAIGAVGWALWQRSRQRKVMARPGDVPLSYAAAPSKPPAQSPNYHEIGPSPSELDSRSPGYR